MTGLPPSSVAWRSSVLHLTSLSQITYQDRLTPAQPVYMQCLDTSTLSPIKHIDGAMIAPAYN